MWHIHQKNYKIQSEWCKVIIIKSNYVQELNYNNFSKQLPTRKSITTFYLLRDKPFLYFITRHMLTIVFNNAKNAITTQFQTHFNKVYKITQVKLGFNLISFLLSSQWESSVIMTSQTFHLIWLLLLRNGKLRCISPYHW